MAQFTIVGNLSVKRLTDKMIFLMWSVVANNIMSVEIKRGYHAVVGTIYNRTLPLLLLESYPGLGLSIRKEILNRRGGLSNSRLQTPGPRIPKHILNAITHAMEHAGIKLGGR